MVGRLSHPEAYIIFKECKDSKNKLVMKSLFKLLGGSVWYDDSDSDSDSDDFMNKYHFYYFNLFDDFMT